jgi:hypothetical protein
MIRRRGLGEWPLTLIGIIDVPSLNVKSLMGNLHDLCKTEIDH